MATDAAAEPSPRGLVGQILDDLRWLAGEAINVGRVAICLMFFVYAIRGIRSSNPLRKYEGHGYLVWAAALWMFAGPEIYGFSAGKQGAIPTLSSTVGNLINQHDWMSVFVIGLLFGGVVQVVKVQLPAHRHRRHIETAIREPDATQPPQQGWTLTAAESGRVTNVPADRSAEVELPVYIRYEIYAATLTAIAFLVPWLAHADKQVVGECGYGVLFTLLFFIPGIIAYRHNKLAPFPGLFTTVHSLERKSKAVTVIVGGGLTFLALHLTFYPFPSILPDLQNLHSHCELTPEPDLCIKP